MTKFTTLSQHIGDANHLYEVGEPREIDEPGNAQHLFNDKVLGPYDEAAEQAWRDSAEARAKAEPATKVDADNTLASLADSKATFGAEIEGLKGDLDAARADLTTAQATIAALTQERDEAHRQMNDEVQSRDSARGELATALETVTALTAERDTLTTERDALKAAAKPHAAKPK
ncbi:hypothetical protein H5J25_13825 [Sphingomonas aliaeris]|uniref:Uncharacterized protein n=1 Tax=Sphingomonas aliaeris TaxID=2759526 RepID=A0A974NTI0_9SPHN|nr:hypothetical protein [Sphingomonas aliaeris]QQV76522.1 hypothetical protein H5J25_13825 [Sphingomonas aliaeris]